MTTSPHRIDHVFLDDLTLAGQTETMRCEREVAIADLTAENYFSLEDSTTEGPYSLYLALSENRLVINVQCPQGTTQARIALPLKPLKTVIRDYFMICESYKEVVNMADTRKMEAVDMGRRGVHNEGAETLKELLEPRAKIDFDTARRLFALICVLHLK